MIYVIEKYNEALTVRCPDKCGRQVLSALWKSVWALPELQKKAAQNLRGVRYAVHYGCGTKVYPQGAVGVLILNQVCKSGA